jgi:general L-amino acid transport system substrate-binding protein
MHQVGFPAWSSKPPLVLELPVIFKAFVVVGVLVATAFLGAFAQGSTMDEVKKRGTLICGVHPNLPGFSYLDPSGERRGFYPDLCRATAAAIGVGVRFIPMTAQQRLPALQAGEVDLLYRNVTYTMGRDTKSALDYAAIDFFDGQGFMVRKARNVTSTKQLAGATVCVETGTTTEKNLADYFRSAKMPYKPLVFDSAENARLGYDAGRCDIYTTDRSALAAQKTLLSKPNEHVILPDVISKEPLGPVTRHGDNAWTDAVRWIFNALVIAEEKGVTQANVDQAKTWDDPEVRRMLGVTDTLGPDTGLPQEWAANAIKAVGNYGEIYERNVAPLGLKRGLNDLWSKGGLMYVPPIR